MVQRTPFAPKRPARSANGLAPVSVTSWVGGLLALVATTAVLLLLRGRLDKAHIALVYLLVVLGGSAAGGRTLGIVLSVAVFLAFNFLFLPPYRTFVIADPLDWLVLFVFLVTGIVAAQLLYWAQREAAVARRRAAEVDRLATLGAETLSAGRAEAALDAIARVIRDTVDVGVCEIFVLADSSSAMSPRIGDSASVIDCPHGLLAARADAAGTNVTRRDTNDDAHEFLRQLTVHERRVGVLRLAHTHAIHLDPTRQRYLDALAYYAALGVERLRLAAEAERASALREADRLKDSLIASVSHDLRTPLTTIRGLAHDIAASSSDGDERALMIEEEVDRLNRLVADLLDLSRLTAGGVPLQLEVNAAEDLMGAALQRVMGVSTEHDIRATLDPDSPILFGRFDLGHSIRILANLLENACKYAPPGSPVDFTVKREAGASASGTPTGDVLAFRVADRGPGVAAEERTRIFAPFYRPHAAQADAGSMGLGLAIARGLAEAQHGSLVYEPRAGGGSVFSLRLPAVDLDAFEQLETPSAIRA
jgi:two-component system, OmpR family, sensor histidine kinase KdpD